MLVTAIARGTAQIDDVPVAGAVADGRRAVSVPPPGPRVRGSGEEDLRGGGRDRDEDEDEDDGERRDTPRCTAGMKHPPPPVRSPVTRSLVTR
ncbi:hypothetical protein GCM10011574_10910 [Microbispora bryophytorum]|uniref:Uncharacterized protein n=1 Tax=Microbispora bryophytorum TaxID=1460882 RepID=A0A8H9L8S0_9ACTN|nr:hypothetical protein GCM10011574_10910 [Microbispora bryophytorum]